jgi:uncharacterized damage-inducible protein DinB
MTRVVGNSEAPTSGLPVIWGQSPTCPKRLHLGLPDPGRIRFPIRKGFVVSMTKDDVQLLYEYDRWANNRVLQAASSLNAQQFTRDLGGSFRSVRDTLVHIISGEWGWLTYWKEPFYSSEFLTDLWNRQDVLFDPIAFPNVAVVQSKWTEVENEQIAFVSCLTNVSLQRMLPYRATQLSLAHLMQHLANHSTYHRGQIALMMRQLDAQPLATDFHVFLAEGREAAAAR